MTETPPVRIPGEGAILPDGTYLTEEQFQTAVDRALAFCDLLAAEREAIP